MCFPKNKFKRAKKEFGIVKNMERKNCDKAFKKTIQSWSFSGFH